MSRKKVIWRIKYEKMFDFGTSAIDTKAVSKNRAIKEFRKLLPHHEIVSIEKLLPIINIKVTDEV